MIKVLLADDHQLMRDGIKSILRQEKEIEILGEASNGEEVLSFLEHTSVDIAIIDIEMPGMDGIDATKIIRKEYPNTKVLILSMYKRKSFILKLMNAGAAGYILKEKSKQQLISAIHNISRGNSHYGIEVINQVTNLDSENNETYVQLSERELEVLCLIAEGLTSKEISVKLSRAEATINTHRRNLLQKLEVPNDKHLVRYAIKHKLVEL